jgi:hypothetical protein
VLGLLDPGCGGVGGVGEKVFGFGVEVVGGARAAGAEEGGERDGRLGEVAVGLGEDAVVVDGGYVGAGGGLARGFCLRLSLGVQEVMSEEEGGGLSTEDSTGYSHFV